MGPRYLLHIVLLPFVAGLVLPRSLPLLGNGTALLAPDFPPSCEPKCKSFVSLANECIMMNNEPNATTSNNTSNCICTNPAYKAWDLCGSCVMSFNVSSNSALQAGVIDEAFHNVCGKDIDLTGAALVLAPSVMFLGVVTSTLLFGVW